MFRPIVYILELSLYDGVDLAFFLLLLTFYSLLIFRRSDPLNRAFVFILMLLTLSSGMRVWVPFWASYFLVLLFLRGILVVLVFIGTIRKPTRSYTKGGGVLLLSLFFYGWFIDVPPFFPFWGFYSIYNLLYFFLIILSLVFFLVSCYLILSGKGALRYLLHI